MSHQMGDDPFALGEGREVGEEAGAAGGTSLQGPKTSYAPWGLSAAGLPSGGKRKGPEGPSLCDWEVRSICLPLMRHCLA